MLFLALFSSAIEWMEPGAQDGFRWAGFSSTVLRYLVLHELANRSTRTLRICQISQSQHRSMIWVAVGGSSKVGARWCARICVYYNETQFKIATTKQFETWSANFKLPFALTTALLASTSPSYRKCPWSKFFVLKTLLSSVFFRIISASFTVVVIPNEAHPELIRWRTNPSPRWLILFQDIKSKWRRHQVLHSPLSRFWIWFLRENWN